MLLMMVVVIARAVCLPLQPPYVHFLLSPSHQPCELRIINPILQMKNLRCQVVTACTLGYISAGEMLGFRPGHSTPGHALATV